MIFPQFARCNSCRGLTFIDESDSLMNGNAMSGCKCGRTYYYHDSVVRNGLIYWKDEI